MRDKEAIQVDVTGIESASDEAFEALRDLFSTPTKINAKPYRRFVLTFDDGKPCFVRDPLDRYLDEILGSAISDDPPDT